MFKTILKFAKLFQKLAGINLNKIKELSARNPYPFSAWFGPDGRAYIPFNVIENEKSEIQIEVEKFLNDFGWTVVDYQKGLAEKNGRKIRIGKLLEKLKYESEDSEHSPTKPTVWKGLLLGHQSAV